jgi:gamma-glutamyltranspeptidase / glutathione hydrolase
LCNPGLAQMLEYLANTERSTPGPRESKLSAVEGEFYCGDVAAAIAAHAQQRGGFLQRQDLASFKTLIEPAAAVTFGPTTLFKCGFWTQGPALLQTLTVLDQFDLASLTHNSADYLHVLLEATKLAYADREQWYGDPRQVDVPSLGLLSERYAELRAGLIDPSTASGAMRPGEPRGDMRQLLPQTQVHAGAPWGSGTVHVNVIDADGFIVSATPSGGWLKSSEVIAALGFPLGNRMMTFYLDPPSHPNRVAPEKRPRTTISPSLAFRDGRPWMAFGSMGGDQQDQWQLQFFLNCVIFGMELQEAIEAPKLSSEHFPGFFAPHDRAPRRVRAEPRLSAAVLAELSRRGHDIDVGPDWSEGYLVAVAIDPETRLLEAGCDPRCTKSEIFPATARCW